MVIENIYIGTAIIAGLGATLFMDISALILQRVFKISSPNYCFVGRWIRYMPGGRFTHANIAATPKISAECATGWIFHYLVGSVFALLLIIPGAGRWFEHPTLLPALLVGMGTVVIPYMIMQPSFGFGIAAAKTPNPAQARLRSFMSHTVYGVGLYLAAYLLSFVVYG